MWDHQSLLYNPYAQAQPWFDWAAQFRTLQQHYMILGNDQSVLELLEIDPTLFVLLIEAVQLLKKAFGDNLVRIRVQNGDDDILLKVAVQLPMGFAAPEIALQSFDSEWWLKNCHRSNSALVFDYELRDGV